MHPCDEKGKQFGCQVLAVLQYKKLHLQETVTVGSRSAAILQISGSNVAEEHAEIFQKGGRTYCKALAGNEEDITSSSYTWLDNSESALRAGMLSSSKTLHCTRAG